MVPPPRGRWVGRTAAGRQSRSRTPPYKELSSEPVLEIAQRVGLSPAPALPWRPALHSVAAGRQQKVAAWALSTTPTEATSILASRPRLRQALRRRRPPDRGPAPGPLALRPAPGHDLALPARPHRLRERRPLRVRPAHRSPLDRPLQPRGRRWPGGPPPLWCAPTQRRRARPAHPNVAEATTGLDCPAAAARAGVPCDVPGHPGPASARAGHLARPRLVAKGDPRRPPSWRHSTRRTPPRPKVR